jgi:hypothetical protein
LALAELAGSPAARQLGATTGFGGSWLAGVAASGAASPICEAAPGGADVAGGSNFKAALGWIPAGAVVVLRVGTEAGAGVGDFSRTVSLGPSSLLPRETVARLGTSKATSHADILPNRKPTVRPANKIAAAANVRKRNVSESLCI